VLEVFPLDTELMTKIFSDLLPEPTHHAGHQFFDSPKIFLFHVGLPPFGIQFRSLPAFFLPATPSGVPRCRDDGRKDRQRHRRSAAPHHRCALQAASPSDPFSRKASVAFGQQIQFVPQGLFQSTDPSSQYFIDLLLDPIRFETFMALVLDRPEQGQVFPDPPDSVTDPFH
jgi:hypothetical protein